MDENALLINNIYRWFPPIVLDFIRHLKGECFNKKLLSLEDKNVHIAHKNKYVGKNCFIVGAGSSLREQDLSKLVDHPTITVSNVYVHPDIESICPIYHVLPNVFHSHGRLYGEGKFVLWLNDMDAKLPKTTTMVLHVLDKDTIEKNCIFSKRNIFWYGTGYWDGREIERVKPSNIGNIWSVSEAALSMAIYFGFDEINLLGFDHDWFNGLMVYFYDKKEHKAGIDEKVVPHVDSEFQMKRHIYIFRKYKALYALHGKIFNCNANKNTYVDVFPVRDYEDVVCAYTNRSIRK